MDIEQRLDRVAGIVESLASTVVRHDDEIEKLIHVSKTLMQVSEKLVEVSERNQKDIDELRRSQAETMRLWQAYLKRLPPQ